VAHPLEVIVRIIAERGDLSGRPCDLAQLVVLGDGWVPRVGGHRIAVADRILGRRRGGEPTAVVGDTRCETAWKCRRRDEHWPIQITSFERGTLAERIEYDRGGAVSIDADMHRIDNTGVGARTVIRRADACRVDRRGRARG